MRLRPRTIAFATLLVLTLRVAHAENRDLTFEQRVQAQEAIERVYYAHQIGATKAFEEAVPREVLERKVATYLRQSAALEMYWHTPITSQMLHREMERQAEQTRMSGRLAELYTALGNDPFLVAECLARPALVDRLSRNFFAYDATIHARKRAEAGERRALLERDGIAAHALDAGWREVELVAEDPQSTARDDTGDRRDDRVRRTTPDDLARLRARLPGGIGAIGAVTEERDRFAIRVKLAEGPRTLTLAALAVEKGTWDDWWRGAAAKLDPLSVRPAALNIGRLPSLPRSAEGRDTPSCLDDTWGPGSLMPFPEGRRFHTAVWTGTEMIVWGGLSTGFPEKVLDSGGRYDPATDTWSSVSVVGNPSPRYQHTTVWTGTEMIVWGGWNGGPQIFFDGARYDPATNTWRKLSDEGAPSARFAHTAIWTGDRMVVWGGFDGSTYLGTGSRYDPVADVWSPTSDIGSPVGRIDHTAVWTGTEMIVWGGWENTRPRRDGGRYDPLADRWMKTTVRGAPIKRFGHAAVWTGTRMIVWGGDNKSTGGQYDPVANVWTPTSTLGAPAPRSGPTAVWTGSRMVVWGGDDNSDISDDDTGGRYDPTTDSWTPTSTAGDLARRSGHSMVWTGTQAIAWGGVAELGDLRDGGRYDPVLDSWTPTALRGSPHERENHATVWTGEEMIVWGGCYDDCYYGLADGARYNPIVDRWTRASVVDAPGGTNPSAVWTGNRMIVFGYSGSAGSYDPRANRWVEISTVGAPSAYNSRAVWTGFGMFVVGTNYNASLLSAGLYDPQTDAWTPASTIDAPEPRSAFTMVWTGREAILWGGAKFPGALTTGGRYDPASDTWTATSIVDVPAPRSSHTAVWTGHEMVVWGGDPGYSYPYMLGNGGRYDPESDTWTATTDVDAPSPRKRHTSVWTGSEMIVWGGDSADVFFRPPAGGRYTVCSEGD